MSDKKVLEYLWNTLPEKYNMEDEDIAKLRTVLHIALEAYQFLYDLGLASELEEKRLKTIGEKYE